MKKVFNFSLLAAAIMFIFSACSSDSTPSGAAKQYGNYLLSGKYDKIADMIFYKDNFSKEEVEEAKEQVVAMMEAVEEYIKDKQGYKKFEVMSESIDGDEALVECVLTYGDGGEDNMKLNFIKKDGKWLLAL